MVWRQWICFVEVGKNHSYAKAANNLFLSPSVVSYHVQNLEKELGVKLFERGPHHVTFTAQGKALFDEIIPILNEFNEAVNSFSRSYQKCEIRISSTYIINYHMFRPLFSEFRTRYPNVTITSNRFDSAHAIRDLIDGRCDICLAFFEEAQQYEGEIDFKTLFEIRRHGILIPLDSPLGEKESVCYADFRGKTVYLPENAEANPRLAMFCKKLRNMGSAVDVVRVPDLISAYEKVSRGSGVCPSIDYVPSPSEHVILRYNREDSLSRAGICIRQQNATVYVRELAELLIKGYANQAN